MDSTRKFAWIPTIVKTWRPCRTKALIWLQTYKITNNEGPFVSLNGESK